MSNQAAGMTAANVCGWKIVQKMYLVGQEVKLGGQRWILVDNLSAEAIVSWYVSKSDRDFFFYNPPITFCSACWQQNFVDFFVLSGAAIDINFCLSLPLESTKWVHSSSMLSYKHEKVKLLGWLFSTGFISFQRR